MKEIDNKIPVTEQELIKRSTGERVTLEAINAAIVGEHYFTAADGEAGAELNRRLRTQTNPVTVNHTKHDKEPTDLDVLTFCVLRLWNGFTVTGESACADPSNFNAEIGRRIAREKAIEKIWPLMGFELKSRLFSEAKLVADRAFVSPNGAPVYIGTKVIHAVPMSRVDYNKLRGWQLPSNENGEDDGYLVEYTDRVENPPHVNGFLGYVSWSPKEVFERAYHLALRGKDDAKPTRERSDRSEAESAAEAPEGAKAAIVQNDA